MAVLCSWTCCSASDQTAGAPWPFHCDVEVNGDAAPRPRTSSNRQMDGRHGTLVIMYIEMCVTMDNKKLPTRHCARLLSFPPRPPATRHHQWLLGSVLRAKVQRIRKGDLADSWFDNLYSLLCSIICNQSQCVSRMTVTPSPERHSVSAR